MRRWVLVRDRERALARARTGYLVQTAYFAPTGFAGWAYGYGIYPFHARIFSDLVKAVARGAEAVARRGAREGA